MIPTNTNKNDPQKPAQRLITACPWGLIFQYAAHANSSQEEFCIEIAPRELLALSSNTVMLRDVVKTAYIHLVSAENHSRLLPPLYPESLLRFYVAGNEVSQFRMWLKEQFAMKVLPKLVMSAQEQLHHAQIEELLRGISFDLAA